MESKNEVCSRGEPEIGIDASAVSNDPKHDHTFLDDYSLLTRDDLNPDSSSEIGRSGTSLRPNDPQAQRPDPLSFLENDSPLVTQESILQAIEQASENWSPRTISSFRSIDSRQPSAAETDATTPEQSVGGDISPTSAVPRPPQLHRGSFITSSPSKAKRESRKRQPLLHPQLSNEGEDRYGTPEMARGSAKHPHFPPDELQPRLAPPGQGYPKYLPRAEKLPMSGYELVAAKLSGSEHCSTRRRSSSSSCQRDEAKKPSIKPIYRKFEALNHRLLLHLQDELSELEEQLHRLDTADTQTRRLRNCILPASRRAEFMAGGELQWRKTDILGKIGFKLGQYNHALDSFTKTLNLRPAYIGDIEDYRTYLATHNPIAEIETRFLDPANDLVCLVPHKPPFSNYAESRSFRSNDSSDGLLTPVPHKMTFGYPPGSDMEANLNHSRPSSSSSMAPVMPSSPSSSWNVGGVTAQISIKGGGLLSAEDTSNTDKDISLEQAAILAALAILLPILTFPVVTDFAGRIAMVVVAGLVVAALRRRLAEAGICDQSLVAENQRVLVGGGGGRIVVGYGVGMAIVAAVF
ncbi:hypothetical protein C8A01DRAFT_20585 [Parachaetomium inaequale]|uniref:DUF6594 domain-containing protein n=1 Tax=Parachaetomium inaequale TaxID=2588326 RepID=A0AAN6P7S4_9PEZI|nr:hypothetical protein C8A01DRAFT_20585 [Parachaetomium inaequale]